MRGIVELFTLLLLICAVPHNAYAVLPPDIIFNVGSQLYALFAGIGVIFFGGLLSIVPYIKDLFEKIQRGRHILVPLLAFFFGISCALFYSFLNLTPVAPIVYPPTTTSSSTEAIAHEYRFFSDQFVIVGKTADGEPLLIDLTLSRKEKKDSQFQHYYSGNVLVGKRSDLLYKTRDVTQSAILSDLLFSRFERHVAADHSSREAYTLQFPFMGKTYTLVTEQLVSDFITKNEPDFTNYVSAGKGTISLDGKDLAVFVMHERTYSTDYRTSIFFAGSDTLKSKSIQMILWDAQSNFYLIDQSDVQGTSTAYASHMWALTKDTNGFARKAFDGSVTEENEGGVIGFSALIPSFDNARILVKLTHPISTKKTEGWVEGTIQNTHGTVPLVGLGYLHTYGE